MKDMFYTLSRVDADSNNFNRIASFSVRLYSVKYRLEDGERIVSIYMAMQHFVV